MDFKTPWLLLLIPIVVVLLFFFKSRTNTAGFRFSSMAIAAGLKETWKIKLQRTQIVLRVLAVILFIIALSGPREVLEETVTSVEGIDIVLAVDASYSMAAEDFTLGTKRVNRLEVVKDVVKDFIKNRSYDRIGLVAFSGLAYTVCPLTTDYDWLVTNLNRIELRTIKDGTAIGSAIASSVGRLEKSKAKSRIIILLTDGVNNEGKIDPLAAAQMAEGLDIKIYTIGAGSKGAVPFPMQNVWGKKVYTRQVLDIDEDTLREIARLTNGQYYRATDTESLRSIYKEIDALEKTEIEEKGYKEYKQLFDRFLIAGLILFVCEILLFNTIFLKIP